MGLTRVAGALVRGALGSGAGRGGKTAGALEGGAGTVGATLGATVAAVSTLGLDDVRTGTTCFSETAAVGVAARAGDGVSGGSLPGATCCVGSSVSCGVGASVGTPLVIEVEVLLVWARPGP